MSFLRFAVVLGFAGWAVTARAETGPLVWQAPNQTNTAKDFEVTSRFIYQVHNISTNAVVIEDVQPSCGCTTAQLPSQPWRLMPNETGKFEALVDLRGKTGTVFKDIKVISSTAPATLLLTVVIPDNRQNLPKAVQDRIWGQALSATDHQAVFKKDCVKCHLVPAFGKSGKKLYDAACGICHEAERRATMVPDLHALKSEIDTTYWRKWVTDGKPGTLMPGFASKEGGPLDADQIDSLVDYLLKAFPRPLRAANAPADDAHD